MKDTISKPVWTAVILAVIIMGILIWIKLAAGKVQPEQVLHKDLSPASDLPVFVLRSNAPSKTTPVTSRKDDDSLKVIPISLVKFVGKDPAYAKSAMNSFPAGKHTFGGIEFWLEGIVRLQGEGTRDSDSAHFPTNIVVPLDETNTAGQLNERGKNIASIYLLGGVLNSDKDGGHSELAKVIWHYDDDSAISVLNDNVHLRDWVRLNYEDPAQLPNANTKVAWRGPHPSRKDITIRLYRLALVNPHPEKTIRAIEFSSPMNVPSLFVAALTLDPLLPGARPDDLTSQEFDEVTMNGQIQILVEDAEGHPLSGAQVEVIWRGRSAVASGSKKYMTDNSGLADVRYHDDAIDSLNINAEHDGFSGRQMSWEISDGDQVPPDYTLKLAEEVTVGGLVVDPENNPLSNASIRLYRFWSGADGDPSRKGEQPSFSNRTVKTGSDGKWEAKGLPKSLLDHVGFEINHPDFMGTDVNVGTDPAKQNQLRAETYKTVLQRGSIVNGLVTDNDSIPISGATVWSGEKFHRERQQTTTGDDGRFSFHNVPGGDVLFAVTAKGHAADNKTVNVHAGMDEITFRLKLGNIIRGHVQDESNQPVASARVALEGYPGDSSYDTYDFNGSTDANGDFSWDGAPDETMTFSILHDDFESKRRVKLAPNQDNTITLHHSRTLEGVVLDATTGMSVTNFSLRTGMANDYNPGSLSGVIRNRSFSPSDGTFTTTIDEESDNAVLVTANGYADTVQKFPDGQNGVVQVTVKMKPAAGLTGVVLASDGSPAPNVNVTAVPANTKIGIVTLANGHFRSWGDNNKTATTDDNGKFTLPSAPDDGMIVAAGDPGFARATIADVRNSGTVTLQAWGRIEGSLKIGGQPGAGKDLLFTMDTTSGVSTDFNGYKATTDDQGNFTMEKIPPGDGYIVRLVPISQNSWMHSDRTAVNVKSGDTTQVTLGDNGALIAGHIRYEVPPINASVNVQGSLDTQMPQRPKFNSPQESQAYYQSPEWQALQKQMKNYAFTINPDGTFEADDVAPGTYSLNITVRPPGNNSWVKPPVAQGSTQVIVPDSFDPASPIDIGEVVLAPPPITSVPH